MGASGGILIGWNSSHFLDEVIDKHSFGITISFTSAQSMDTWFLTTVYGPCDSSQLVQSSLLGSKTTTSLTQITGYSWEILTSIDLCLIETSQAAT